MSITDTVNLLKDGDLQGALATAKAAVREKPGDTEARARLFQLFALDGDWDRAEAQLDALGTAGPGQAPIWNQFRILMRLERQRRDCYATGEAPAIVGEPQDWMAGFAKSFGLHQQGDLAGAATLREEALAEAPATKGRIDGVDFDWVMDGDVRLGPMLEAMLPTEGDYCWVPFSLLGALRIERPTQVNHFIWSPAHFTWKTGEVLHGYVPTRYLETQSAGDQALKLSRGTDWVERGEGLFEGRGQRVLMSEDNDFPLLDIRDARFNP